MPQPETTVSETPNEFLPAPVLAQTKGAQVYDSNPVVTPTNGGDNASLTEDLDDDELDEQMRLIFAHYDEKEDY